MIQTIFEDNHAKTTHPFLLRKICDTTNTYILYAV